MSGASTSHSEDAAPRTGLGAPVGALSGIRVLELGGGVAAPYCASILAGLGAEVVKIEAPFSGDATRSVGPFKDEEPHIETSALFFHLNRGKKSVTLDLDSPAGRDILRRLVLRTDILLESLPPGLLESLGFTYEALSATNDQLVLVHISPFGRKGPCRDYAWTDAVLQALGGYMFQTGEPDREPVPLAGEQTQYQGGLQAAIGTLMALLARDSLGRGQEVDVSLLACIAGHAALATSQYHATGDLRRRAGNRHAESPTAQYPDTTLPCKDGYIHVQGARWEFDSLALLVGEPRLLEFKFEQRAHADEMDELLLPWLARHDRMEATLEAQELRMPFAPVLTIAEVLADPQHAAREYFVPLEHAFLGRVTTTGAPARLAVTPWQTDRAPYLGEHNAEVFGDLGVLPEDLALLRQQGVL